MNSIVDALVLLTPFDIDKPKIRLGPRGDGGYIFVDDLRAEQDVVSYGIGDNWRLDLEFAKRGHRVYMFDHTIGDVEVPHAHMRSFPEGVAGVTNENARTFSIEDHLSRHSIDAERLILKMDVEGAELEALESISDSTCSRFDQMVVEVHHLDLLLEADFRTRFCRVLRKINQHLTLFHVHANNFDGPSTFEMIGGFTIPRILELSYVRKSSVGSHTSHTLYPTPLDFPNTPQRDKLLWMFPFLPTMIPVEEFMRSAERVTSECEYPQPASNAPSPRELREQLDLKEAELQRTYAAAAALREQLELKEAELQRLYGNGVELREQLDIREAELQRLTTVAADLRQQLESNESDSQGSSERETTTPK